MRPVRLALPLTLLLALSLLAVPALAAAAATAPPTAGPADSLDALAHDFWAWRALHQPFSGDDIPRLERPATMMPDWSPASIAAQRKALAGFEARWKALDPSGWPVPRQVDYRLIGSALARVHWELDVNPAWRRNPIFYVEQTLGSVFILLLQPPPFDAARSAEIVARLDTIPRTLEDAKTNLDDMREPFARRTIAALGDVRPRLLTFARALKPRLTPDSAAKLDAATEEAIVALESFRAWLQQQLPRLPQETAIGRDAYVYFLKNVALLPYTPEQLLAMSHQEWDRAVAFEAYEKNRNRGVPPLKLLPDQAAVVAQEKKDEQAVRDFYERENLLTIPPWMKHYWLAPLPSYLEPLAGLGVTDDLTSPSRLDQNATSYIEPPSPALGYFELATAEDPRTQIVHEGAHYMQGVLSFANPDPIRRHYYDSGANEGIAFYNEELMLRAGLFSDSPHVREIICNMMRLRALRVEVDVKLALGLFTILQAADYLRTHVPMDAQTANGEAAFFAGTPGQAITYQIGKLQILAMLADARLQQGEKFSLRAFHDYVWKNGNVPFALQRWELLGLRDQVDALDHLR